MANPEVTGSRNVLECAASVAVPPPPHRGDGDCGAVQYWSIASESSQLP